MPKQSITRVMFIAYHLTKFLSACYKYFITKADRFLLKVYNNKLFEDITELILN
jgi:hypothetical protein